PALIICRKSGGTSLRRRPSDPQVIQIDSGSNMAVIYHNPRCGTSRKALQALQDKGYEVEVIEYLKHPLKRDALAKMIAEAGLNVRQAVRTKESLYTELGLDAPSVSDEVLLQAM